MSEGVVIGAIISKTTAKRHWFISDPIFPLESDFYSPFKKWKYRESCHKKNSRQLYFHYQLKYMQQDGLSHKDCEQEAP